MSLGYEVNKQVLDAKLAQASLMVRHAFDQVESVAKWLINHPVANAVDPLVEEFGYSVDEAYAVRIYFETLDGVRTANTSTFDTGRKMTGLE